MISDEAVEAALGRGFTDGYGWIETDGPVEIVTDLRKLDWLREVIEDTANPYRSQA